MTTVSEPATLDQEGKPPVNRFSTFAGIQSAYESARQEYFKNDSRFSSIRGIYDRLPPENPEYLRAQGLEDMPNFNLGEFTSKVDSYVSTWIDHNTGGYKFFRVKLKRKPENPPELSDAYDDKVTDFFNEAITEWNDDEEVRSAGPYILESCVRDLQMGLFGIGVSYFKDDVDWRFCAIPTRKVFVQRGTKITLTNCPALFIETETTVTDLYNRVKAAKEDDGWDKKQVNQMLYDRTSESNNTTGRESFGEWENRVRNNDDFLKSNFSPVELVDCYVQEFSTTRKKNGISHYIIARSGSPSEILFKKDRRYKSYSFIKPFSDNSGPEGDWHGVKGFGDSIYDNCHFQNGFFNHAARAAMIANMPMFNTGSESDRDKVAQIKWTNMGVLNPGIQISQVNIRQDLNGMMGVFQASQRMVNTNSRTYPAGESMGQEAKTATQSTFDRQDQAKLSSLQIKFYRMVGLDGLGAEMYRRISRPSYPETLPGGRAAASFREKCKNAGIPKECYSEPIEVQADRTGGTGNMALDVMKAEKLFGIATPGRGQLNARMEIAKAIIQSGDRVQEFVQPEELPKDGQGYVNLENSCLADGQTFGAEPQQDHILHLGDPAPDGRGHLGVLLTIYQTAAEMAKQGAIENALPDAQKLDRALEAALGHCAMHVQLLGQFNIPQYQEMAKDLNKVINDMSQFLQTFRQQVGAAMEKQQPQGPQMSAKDQAVIISAQVRAQVEAAMAEQRMRLKEADQMQKLGNMAERSAAKNEISAAEKQQQMEQKAAEFDLSMGQKAVDAMSAMEIEKAARTRAQANVEQAE